MSSFKCEHCNKDILDTPNGYITGCTHYPLEKIKGHVLIRLTNDARLKPKYKRNEKKQFTSSPSPACGEE